MLDAAGFDLILIETVGTGQSEVEVAAAADTTVVLEAPEMGDEVQAIKAGLLEVADLVVVNKGDEPGAQRTARAAPGDAGRLGATERPAGSATTQAPGRADHHGRDRGRRAGAARRARSAPRSRAGGGVVGGPPGPSRGAGLRDRRRTSPGRFLEPARGSATVALLGEVAAHRLDPYSAADQLLGDIDP